MHGTTAKKLDELELQLRRARQFLDALYSLEALRLGADKLPPAKNELPGLYPVAGGEKSESDADWKSALLAN